MYADHAATSHPVLFEAVPGYGNAAAGHRLGREARDAMDGARRSVAASLRLPLTGDVSRHVIVTSGGTEANNLIIQQPSWRYIVTLPTEHQAVYLAAQAVCADAACELVCLTPDGTGLVDLEELRAVLAEYAGRGPGLVSIAYVNNEIGAVQDLLAIGQEVKAVPGAYLHTDAVQAPGHVPVDLSSKGQLALVDYLSLSAHKFHGPYGLGFLVCRQADGNGPLTHPLMFGGHQQNGLRPGTEPVGAAVAAAAALHAAVASDARPLYLQLSSTVWSALLPFVLMGAVLPTGPGPTQRSPHIVSFCVRGAHRRDLAARLEREGVLASGGSACSTDSDLPSHVLAAIGVPPEYIHGSLRLSFGPGNTVEEANRVLVPALLRTLRAHSI